MRTVNLPRTELTVSVLCLGGVPLGGALDEAASFRLLDLYMDRGGNFVDTAKVYADWLPGERSSSEKCIGRWLRARGNRARVVLATKGAHPDLATMDVPRLSPAEIVADLDASLANLQTDVIDLYWLHRDDEQRPVGEILETLEAQRRAGKIRAYGCSNWRTPRIQAAGAYATEHSLPGFAADQMMWSYAAIDPSALGDPSMVVMDDDLYTYHVESRLAAIPYSSQARGFFQKLAAGRVRKDDAGLRPYAGKANRRRLERLRRLAAATGHTITGLALAYLTSQPFVTVPIIGSRTEAQLVDSLQAAEIELAPREVAYLEQA